MSRRVSLICLFSFQEVSPHQHACWPETMLLAHDSSFNVCQMATESKHKHHKDI